MLKRLILAMTLVLAAACGEGDDDDTAVDARTSQGDGGSFGDSGASIDSSAVTGTFGAACTGTGQGTCNSGLMCYPFNQDGPHCTKSCTAATAATACAPSTFGCNGMNVCKIRQ